MKKTSFFRDWLNQTLAKQFEEDERKKNFTQHKFCLQKFFNHVISFLQRTSTTQNKFLSEKKFFKCETVLIFEWTKSDICKFTTEEERLNEQFTCSCSCWSFWEKKCKSVQYIWIRDCLTSKEVLNLNFGAFLRGPTIVLRGVDAIVRSRMSNFSIFV